MVQFLKQYRIYFILLVYFIVNIPILNNFPFSLDHRYMIKSVEWIKNPIYAWFPWSIYYKSWPLSYTFYWILLKLFYDQVVFYRTFNLILHFINFLLFNKILNKKNKTSKLNFLSLLFLFHPLATLPIVWEFQLKTLLATSLILLFFLTLMSETKFKNTKLIFIFWLSLTAKVQGILLPFYFLVKNKRTSFSRKLLIPTLSLFSIAFIYGLLNLKGVSYLSSEIKSIQKNLFQAEKPQDPITDPTLREINQPYENKDQAINFDIRIYDEIKYSAQIYFSSFEGENQLLSKHLVAMQNLGRLLTSTFGFQNYLPIYESNTQTLKSNYLYLYVCIGCLFLSLLLLKKNTYLLFGLLLFIPISGYFYVPYMKYSFTSDHWFYPILPFILMGAFSLTRNKYLWTLTTAFIISGSFFNIYKYRTFPNVLNTSYLSHKNKVALEAQSYYYTLYNNWEATSTIYKYLLDNKDYLRLSHYWALSDSAIKTGKTKIIQPYYGRFSSKLLTENILKEIKYFLIQHENIAPERTLFLTEVLGTVNTRNISEENYQRAISFLEEKKEDQPSQ